MHPGLEIDPGSRQSPASPARFPLATLPTPLVRARRLEAALGSPPLYVKRDDLTGFALAGNKARKLEYLLGDALGRRCDMLVTGGGPASNHVAATAAAARVAGLTCLLILFGDEPASPPLNLRLARSFGGEVRFTGDADRASVDHALERCGERLQAEGRRPYVIPRGGATAVGALGYALAADELASQMEQQGVEPDVVVVAAGSCGTQAGIVAGLCSRTWRVVGASVSRPPHECRESVLTLSRACAALLDRPGPNPETVEVHDARGPGYGIPSAAGLAAAQIAARSEGLLLDPVYTAKALALLISLAEETAGPLVFWHTGGVASALDHAGKGD